MGNISVFYQNSEQMQVQGSKQDVIRRYGKTWTIAPLGGGNGNWILSRPADILINGISCKDKILMFYGRSRVSEKLAQQVAADLQSGKVSLSTFVG